MPGATADSLKPDGAPLPLVRVIPRIEGRSLRLTGRSLAPSALAPYIRSDIHSRSSLFATGFIVLFLVGSFTGSCILGSLFRYEP